MKGYDLELLRQISSQAKIPVIASGGGAGTIEDLIEAIKAGADALAIASLLHFKKMTIGQIKAQLKLKNIKIRL